MPKIDSGISNEESLNELLQSMFNNYCNSLCTPNGALAAVGEFRAA